MWTCFTTLSQWTKILTLLSNFLAFVAISLHKFNDFLLNFWIVFGRLGIVEQIHCILLWNNIPLKLKYRRNWIRNLKLQKFHWYWTMLLNGSCVRSFVFMRKCFVFAIAGQSKKFSTNGFKIQYLNLYSILNTYCFNRLGTSFWKPA